MSVTYEFEWTNVVNNISYPFEIPPPFESNVILDLSINLKSRIYLKRFEFRPTAYDIYIARASDDFEVAKVENLPYTPLDAELVNTVTGVPIGYLTIGEGISSYEGILLSQLYTSEETQFEYWANSNTDVIQTINNIDTTEVIWEEGFNFSIFEQSTGTLKFSPELGKGRGEFCGQPIFLDAIYSINGVVPDSQGNIETTHANQFLIRLDPDTNTVIWSLAIPEDRLACERTGFLGSDGFTGALGPDGLAGFDSLDSCIAFDSVFGENGSTCCECDSEEDFCEEGDIAELTPEEVLAELGISANDGSIDPDLLALLGIPLDEE